MKHVPERHQSILPPPSVLIIFGALILVMLVIYTVVSLAEG